MTNKIVFPATESMLMHIFRDAEGHVSDTPENRLLLLDVANDHEAQLKSDKYGSYWSARLLADGRQVWAEVRGGKIVNAGINETPRNFNRRTGLKKP